VLQGKGYKVAIVTDGRMSGASGKVPAAIHVSPEVVADGPLGKVRNGDIIRLDAVAGTLNALVDEAEWESRGKREDNDPRAAALSLEQRHINAHGMGRELFGGMRRNVLSAEEGAVTWL
jgi:phosphogluconate dehydratase